MTAKSDRVFWAGAGILVCLTLLVFARSLDYDFSYYDDDLHVMKNPVVQNLSASNLGQIFTKPYLTSYYPLRTLSFAFDYACWALNPRGYHATNVAIHCMNVLLVFVLAVHLLGSAAPGGGSTWAAGLGAALFAVHPVVVEPVVWVSGREELLMVFFALLSMAAYTRARAWNERDGRLPYAWMGLTIGFCAAACLSNALGMVLPALIAAYDFACVRDPDASLGRWGRRVLARTWPLWLIAGATLVVKLISDGQQPAMGSLRSAEDLTVLERIRVIPGVYWLNLKTLFWPRRLFVSYPNDIPKGFLSPGVWLGTLCGLGTIAALWKTRGRGLLLFGLLWFMVALAPSAQIVPHHIFRADRFLYLPLVGAALAAAGLLHIMPDRWPARQHAAVVGAVCVALALGVCSIKQTLIWRDGLTLFSHAFKGHPLSPVVRTNLANALVRAGRHADAIPHFQYSLKVASDDADSHFNLANALRTLGRTEEAIVSYSRAVAIRPDDFEIHNNLAAALPGKQEFDAALRHFSRALGLDPGNLDLRCNMAALLGTRNRHEEAIREFSEVLRRRPDFSEARMNIAISLLKTGEREAAIVHLSEALRVQPDSVKARTILAALLHGRSSAR